MKVFSVVLLIGLVVTISEGYVTGNRDLGFGGGLSGMTSILEKGPGAITSLFDYLGIDAHALNQNLDLLIKILDSITKPGVLKNKVKDVANILAKGSNSLGIAVKTDFHKLTKDAYAKIVPGLELVLKAAKMIRTALHSVPNLKL